MLLPRQAKAHKTAGMVVSQNAVAHALPAWHIFCGFNVICVIWNLTKEDHAGIPHHRVIGNAVALDAVAMGNELLDGFLPQPTSRFMPKIQRGLKLFDVVVSQSGRKCGQQKLRVGLPRVR